MAVRQFGVGVSDAAWHAARVAAIEGLAARARLSDALRRYVDDEAFALAVRAMPATGEPLKARTVRLEEKDWAEFCERVRAEKRGVYATADAALRAELGR